MKFSLTKRDIYSQNSAAALIFLFEKEQIKHPPELHRLCRSAGSKEFAGQTNQVLWLHTEDRLKPKRVLLVGLGKRQSCTSETVRRAVGKATRRLCQAGIQQISVNIGHVAHLQAITEALLLTDYQFTEFKSPGDRRSSIKSVTFCLSQTIPLTAAKQSVNDARISSEAANYARDIANRPGNIVYPAVLAREARQLAAACKLKCTVLDQAALRRGKFGGLLAVGGGSQHHPRLIVLEYKPPRATNKRPVALVGKAITFDSGGLSLKPSAKMDEMKFDKCGGVAVLGAMRSIAQRTLPVHVVGIIASAENLPSNTSYRPGDIVTSYRGTDRRAVTIEVGNTDAEGRIVLGDALVYARRYKPEAIIDLATLTGACVVALGSHAAGLMGNNEKLQKQLQAAGDKTGERVWPLPLWPEHREMIKSNVADHCNIGGREAGALTAGAFLSRYVDDVPWAHLDIAGTAWTTKELPYMDKGATGYGVRLLTELLSRWH